MKNKNLILFLFSILTGATFSDDLELVKEQENNVLIKEYDFDNSRIYLKEGAIWATRDIVHLDPQLELNIAYALVRNTLLDEKRITFDIESNYAYYIDHVEIDVYGKKGNNEKKIKTLYFKDIEENTVWEMEENEVEELVKYDQIRYEMKVFDKKGVFDYTSLGIANIYETDKDQENLSGKLIKKNIQSNGGLLRLRGIGLYGVDKIKVGNEEFQVEDNKLDVEKFMPSNTYEFETEVIYENGKKEVYDLYIKIPERQYHAVGFADLYFGQNYLSGNISGLNVANEYSGNFYNKGRLAFYGKYKLSDDLRLTAYIDTEENKLKDMFKEFYKSDSESIFDRVEDEDKFYGTYGDNSFITKDFNTNGKLYLNVDYKNSNVLWGNYNTGFTGTEFATYNRSLYGYKLDYRSEEITTYGENKSEIKFFGASANTAYAHDELLGTGGSLYFLRNGDVVTGSQKVYIKIVDEKTNMELGKELLVEGEDYTIDEYQGRVILHKPLSQMSRDAFDSVIKNGANEVYDNYLVVDYEYIPKEDFTQDTFGFRGKYTFGDNFAIGTSYINEDSEKGDYSLYGIDSSYRIGEKSYVRGEYNYSEGDLSANNFVSFDGGLSFTKVENTNEFSSGEAYSFNGKFDLNDFFDLDTYDNQIDIWYKNKDEGFEFASKDINKEYESYGFSLKYNLNEKWQFRSSYSNYSGSENNEEELVEETNAILSYDFDNGLFIDFEGKNQKELDGEGLLLGTKLTYEFNDDYEIYGTYQDNVSSKGAYEDNSLYTLGAKAKLTRKFSVEGEYSRGDRGDNKAVSLDYDLTDNFTLYTTFDTDSFTDKLVFGQKYDYSDKMSIYTENQFVDEEGEKGNIDSYGIDYSLNDQVDFFVSLQQGEIYKETTEKREAYSFGVSGDMNKVDFRNKIEYRLDENSEKTKQFISTNRIIVEITEEYTLGGKFNYSTTREDEVEAIKFVESNLSIAYRPIYNDKLNFLGRYTKIIDKDNSEYRDYSFEDSDIYEIEGIYALFKRLDLGLKFAYKDKKEMFQREDGSGFLYETNIYLVGIKGTYEIINNFDIFSEYHYKIDKEENDVEDGFILAFNKHMSDYFKVGLGYNFTSFEDDLRRDDYDANGWFVNLIGKI